MQGSAKPPNWISAHARITVTQTYPLTPRKCTPINQNPFSGSSEEDTSSESSNTDNTSISDDESSSSAISDESTVNSTTSSDTDSDQYEESEIKTKEKIKKTIESTSIIQSTGGIPTGDNRTPLKILPTHHSENMSDSVEAALPEGNQKGGQEVLRCTIGEERGRSRSSPHCKDNNKEGDKPRYPPKCQQTNRAEAIKGPKVVPWTDLEIRFYSADSKTPLTCQIWDKLQTEIKCAYAIWAKVYLNNFEDGDTIRIQNPRWDPDLHCGIITMPEGSNAKKIRDGFIPTLRLPTQLKAIIKEDFMAPVVKTTMPDQLYNVFTTEEHLEFMKIFNPILEQHMFKIHRSRKKKDARVVQIKTTEEVVDYLKEKNFTILYPSGEVIFQTKISRARVSNVYTLPDKLDQRNQQAGAANSKPKGQASEMENPKEDSTAMPLPPNLHSIMDTMEPPSRPETKSHEQQSSLPIPEDQPTQQDPMELIYNDVSLAPSNDHGMVSHTRMAKNPMNKHGQEAVQVDGLAQLADAAQINVALDGGMARLANIPDFELDIGPILEDPTLCDQHV